MSAAENLVPVNEYLHTVYEEECDYVDGVLENRYIGEMSHSRTQGAVLLYLHARRKQWNLFVLSSWTMRLSPTRYRIPDVTVIVGAEPDEQILTSPPFICVEVVSPEDRWGQMMRKISDYLAFGVRHVWLIDPETRMAWDYTPGAMRAITDVLRTENPDIVLPLNEVFEDY